MRAATRGGLRLSFFGAAQNVTGSRYLLESGGTRVLVDCGLYQEREFAERNWDPFPVPPASIAAVVLTHAHVDHCGWLPRLVREGFAGSVVCTRPTADIARIVLLDSAKLQVEDAEYKKRRHRREKRRGPRPVEPLYTVEDAEAAIARLAPAPYGRRVGLAPGVGVEFLDAGHILGSSSVLLSVGRGAAQRTVLFSGDVGRWDKPLIRDPRPPAGADYVVVESTYGDRRHGAGSRIPRLLVEAVEATRKAGGNLVVPSFAIERAQELLYHLNHLLRTRRIPHLMVFLDSPMAVRVTDVFTKHLDVLDEETRALFDRGASPFEFPGLKLVRTVAESKAINQIRGTAMIIAGSGMCTGGRIKHHLFANISRPESTVVFVGYQAVGTLGRQILDGKPEVRIHGQMHRVRARIVNVPGFSAHADRAELTRWLGGLGRPPRGIFVTHGEPDSARAFAAHLRRRFGWKAAVPRYRESAELP